VGKERSSGRYAQKRKLRNKKAIREKGERRGRNKKGKGVKTTKSDA
jgi:hypothetical protein